MARPHRLQKIPKRYKQKRARLWLFDFRGIQTTKPNKTQLQLLRKINRSYRGEKPTFTSPQQLQDEIDQYFESCYGPLIDHKKHQLVRDEHGQVVKVQVRPFTVAGLAYYIGIPTEQLDRVSWGYFDSLDDSTEDDMLCSAILKRAKQRIAMYSEQRLFDREGVKGAQFVLDHHFHMLSKRDEAEIEALNKQMEYKMEELEMKKRALDLDGEDNEPLQITIVRKDE